MSFYDKEDISYILKDHLDKFDLNTHFKLVESFNEVLKFDDNAFHFFHMFKSINGFINKHHNNPAIVEKALDNKTLLSVVPNATDNLPLLIKSMMKRQSDDKKIESFTGFKTPLIKAEFEEIIDIDNKNWDQIARFVSMAIKTPDLSDLGFGNDYYLKQSVESEIKKITNQLFDDAKIPICLKIEEELNVDTVEDKQLTYHYFFNNVALCDNKIEPNFIDRHYFYNKDDQLIPAPCNLCIAKSLKLIRGLQNDI